MPELPELYIMQWILLGIYIVIYFFVGIRRGAPKSLYFTLVNFITTFVVIALISNLSIRFIFNFFDEQTFYNTINGWTGGALTDYMVYLQDPAITRTIYIFIDLVFRIVAFFLLFPVMKRILSGIIFRPIWNHLIKNAIVKSQNNGVLPEKKKDRKIKSSPLSRLLGGFIGAVEGLIMAFIILIPVTVTASFFSGIDTTIFVSMENNQAQLATLPGTDVEIPDDFIRYLEEVQRMDEEGVTVLTREIKINGLPIDRYIFDEMFSVQTEVNEEAAEVNFFNELESLFGVITVVVNGGYIDPNFDYTQISDENLDDLELIMGYIGESDLLQYLIPTGAKYAVDNYLNDELNIDLTDRQATEDALDMFYSIDWQDEFDRLYSVVESVLEFGSVQEIINMLDNPNQLANLTPEQGEALANIIRNIGDLEILTLVNVGIDYATTQDFVQSGIGWLDTPTEKEAYLQDRLSFILDDPDFFVGENGEISDIADLIELLFTDTYGDTNINDIIASSGDVSSLLGVNNSEWISAVISQLTELDLIMHSLPIGADYALYDIGGDDIDDTLADQFQTAMDDVNWDDEFTNFDAIYQSIAQLGLEQILVDNPDYYAYLDTLMESHLDDVRDIVGYIFEDSQIVGSALEILAPQMIDRFVSDPEMADLIKEITLDDEQVLDFNFGQEIINILNIAEYAYGFVDASSLGNFSALEQEQQLQILQAFGQMSDTDYEAFIQAFDDLQILNRIDENIGAELINQLELNDTVYLPSTFALNDDVTAILGLIHDVGVFLDEAYVVGTDLQDIDLTNLLDVLSADLLDADKRSDLLFYNMAFYAKNFAEDDSIGAFVSVPDSLLNADIESQAWDDELNALFGSVFDIARVVGETDGITLSFHDLTLYSSEAYRLPVELITQFSDPLIAEDAFGSLDQSLILRSSIKNAIDAQAIELMGHVVTVPDHLVTDGALNEDVFVNLIEGFATFVSGMNDTLGYNQFGEFNFDDLTPIFNAYNSMDKEDVEALVESDLLKGMISDVLLDDQFITNLSTTINDAQDILDFPDEFFAVPQVLVNGPVLVDGEITNIFTMFQALELSGLDGFSNIGLETFTNLVVADAETGEDNFDEFFASDYVYSILDKVLRLDSISAYVGTTLGDSLGADFSTLDLSIPNTMLGQTDDVGITITAVEEGRIPKAEFRRVLTSIGTLGDLGDIGLNTFTDMIDPTVSNDDFATFIASDFIYLVLARLIGNDGFSGYAEDMLSGAFGDDPITLDMSVPDDAKGNTGIETGLLTRVELRNLMISFNMLGIGGETAVDVSSIIALPSSTDIAAIDEDLATDDDLDVFLKSTYLADKMSQMLLSSTIINLIGAGQFDATDFDLPTNAYDPLVPERLATEEIHKLFYSLVILNISNFDSVDIGIDTVVNLEVSEQQALLDALYLYEVIDLMIKAQAVDPLDPLSQGLTIPVDAYVSGGFYDGMISQTEILSVLSVFDIDGIGTDPSQINMDAITTATFKEVLNKDSVIINQMISDQIETALSIDQLIVPEAYEAIVGVDRITKDEMLAMVEAMTVMNITDLSTSIAVNNVGLSELQDIHYLGLGTNPTPAVDYIEYDSYIIHNLITEQIETALSIDDVTLPEAYTNISGMSRLVADEIQALINAMSVIGVADLSGSISVSTVTVANLQDLHYLGLGDNGISDPYDSYIIHTMISDQVEAALNVDELSHPEAYTNITGMNRMQADEIQALINAMGVIGVSDLSGSISVSTVTVANLQDLHYLGLGDNGVSDPYDSYIVHTLITDQIASVLNIDILTLPEAYTNISGVDRMQADEVQALINAMTEMNITDLSVSFNADDINVTQLQNLHYLGLGDNGVSDPYDSYIVHRMLSDGIKTAVTDIPTHVYMSNGDILANEVQGIISAVGILNSDPNASLSAMSFASGELTPAKIGNLLDLNALIVDRQISTGVIGSGLAVDEAYAVNGDFTYDPGDPGVDIKPEELYALVAAMTEMNVTDLSAAFDASGVTVSQLQNIHYIGLGDNGISDPYDSYIIHHMISDAIKTAITNRPNNIYMANTTTDIIESEIQGVISAVAILNTDPNATLGSMSFANNGLTSAKIESLLDLDKLIIYRQISEGIISAGLDVSLAYTTIGDANYEDGYATGNLKVSEMYAVVEAMNIMGLTDLSGSFDPNTISVANLQALHYVGLGVDPVSDEFDSYIVHHMISDGVLTAITNIPTNVYMANTEQDLIADEIQGVIDAVLVLNDNDTNGTLGAMSFANNGLTATKIESLLDLDKLIIYRQISEGIRSANLDVTDSYAGALDTNYDSGYANGNLKISEMYAVVDAMNIMGLSDLSGSFDPATITVSNLQALHYVGLGIDPGTDTYQSTIVHHMISDAVKSSISNRPSNVYMGNVENDILADEIQGVIDAVLVLNDNDTNGTLGAMSFANGGLSPAKITALLDIDKLIIYRQISEGMISANVDVPEAYAISGEANYETGYANGNLNIDEMYAIAEAMTVMGLSDLTSSFDATNLSVVDLQSLHYIGLGDNGVSDPYDSYMVHNMISDALETSLPSIGTIAYSGDYIKAVEIQGFIDDLNILGINSIGEFATINSGNVMTIFGDDAEVTAVFANSTANSLTITYYLLDDILDPSDSTLVGVSRSTDAYGVTVVDRDDLRDFIILNN